MLFNSYEFLWFFPLSLTVYWLLSARLRLQNLWLLAASYFFYAWWDVRFLLLIAAITLAAFVCGLLIEHFRASQSARRAVLAAGIALSVGTLCLFKYYNFFVTEFQTAFPHFAAGLALPLLRVALPVGISFYTFQVVGYMADVYRREVPAARDVVSFAAFVSFFPQLVAGPIERAGSLLGQIERPRTLRAADVTEGLRLILWGLVKKMLLADTCAPAVNAVYANPDASSADLWAAAVLFAFQIYGDFSGYSDIAVGTARLFGIRLSCNFRLPYFSQSVPEFWRRWHITLMEWLKDYVYIPLGGSRCRRARWVGNLTLVFLLSGIWHGANWTFVAWGLFQLIGYVPHIINKGRKETAKGRTEATRGSIEATKGRNEVTKLNKETAPCRSALLSAAVRVCKTAATFLFVCTGWVLFRSESLGAALVRLGRMFGEWPAGKPCCGLHVFLPAVFVMVCEYLTRHRAYTLDLAPVGPLRYRAVRWALYYALLFAVFYWGGAQTAFIYFQF